MIIYLFSFKFSQPLLACDVWLGMGYEWEGEEPQGGSGRMENHTSVSVSLEIVVRDMSTEDQGSEVGHGFHQL